MNDPTTLTKTYITEQHLMLDGFRLGKQIFKDGFVPDLIVGIWRGGSSVGIVVQECLQYLGVEADHIPIRTSYNGMLEYTRNARTSDKVRVHGLDYLVQHLNSEDKLLLVDDVYSSGVSIQAVKERLRKKTRHNCPEDIRTAAVWHRPNEDRPAPDYFIHTSNDWLVLPYELSGLSKEEIKLNKPWVGPYIEGI